MEYVSCPTGITSMPYLCKVILYPKQLRIFNWRVYGLVFDLRMTSAMLSKTIEKKSDVFGSPLSNSKRGCFHTDSRGIGIHAASAEEERIKWRRGGKRR